jgi:hypothetical protein
MKWMLSLLLCLLVSVGSMMWLKDAMLVPRNYAGDGGPDIGGFIIFAMIALLGLISGIAVFICLHKFLLSASNKNSNDDQ